MNNNIKTLRENLMRTNEYIELKAELDRRTGWLQKISKAMLVALRVLVIYYMVVAAIGILYCGISSIYWKIREFSKKHAEKMQEKSPDESVMRDAHKTEAESSDEPKPTSQNIDIKVVPDPNSPGSILLTK